MPKLFEGIVATRTVCAEGSLDLVSEVGSSGDKIKAAVGTHRTCGHYSFKQLVNLARLQPSCTRSELKTCSGARDSLYWL